MARAKDPPPSKILTAADMQQAVRSLNRRIDELDSFDSQSISKRFEATSETLKDRMNSTLADIFGEGTPEYQRYWVWSFDSLPLVTGLEYSLDEVRASNREGVQAAATKLKSLRSLLLEKLDDLEGWSPAVVTEIADTRKAAGKNVFVVHGHDERAKQAVARFLEKLGLAAVILHEQPNHGRTIIEKLEAHASDVDFALILLTPDDIGSSVAAPGQQRSRARQNVILELGLFIGRLGRHRVCALHTGDLEFPSDYAGVLYVPLDPGEGWKMQVAREMKSAGLDIDLNRLF